MNGVSITSQNLIEFWAVATRPEIQNGLGLSVEEASHHIASFKSIFALLPEDNRIFDVWEKLVAENQVIGKQVYHARLVAAMRLNKLTHLLTFNVRDFKRFSEIIAISPITIADDAQTE